MDDDSLATQGVFDDSRHPLGRARHSYGHVTMLALGGAGVIGPGAVLSVLLTS